MQFDAPPETIAYCHCQDCRRVSGAPVTAFAACSEVDVVLPEAAGLPFCLSENVTRWFCRRCGSPLAAKYTYLPEQVYIPVGLFDRADRLHPKQHAHADSALPWLKIDDSLPRHGQSAAEALHKARGKRA